MANLKISDLGASGALGGSEVFELEVGGVSYKVTATQIQTFVLASYPGDTTITTTGTITAGTWNSVVKKRIQSVASSASITPLAATIDMVRVTALAINTTINNPTGTPNEGQILEIRLRDNGTGRTITWGANYRFSSSLTDPGTTTANRTLYYVFQYNETESKWDCIDIKNNYA